MGPIPSSWDSHIYLHEWLIFMVVNVGEYTSPMDCLGMDRCNAKYCDIIIGYR